MGMWSARPVVGTALQVPGVSHTNRSGLVAAAEKLGESIWAGCRISGRAGFCGDTDGITVKHQGPIP